MALADRWLLPDGVKEILPPQARQVESLRRKILDIYDNWGYEQVMPPLVEHLESLLTGVGKDLELNTYKLVDQSSGLALGLRADITPQVARIDAHRMQETGANRLCYCGSVVHTRAENMLASRNPLQVGAEIYGHDGIESDVEVISLMLETVIACGLEKELSLDLGHVDVFREILQWADLSTEQAKQYRELVQKKALADLALFMQGLEIDAPRKELLSVLPTLNGGVEVLQKALSIFADAPAAVTDAVIYLQKLSQMMSLRYPGVDQYFDLAELRGYNYHSGVVFAALTPSFGQAVAKGGRYDSIGKDFGRSRAATGFSTDLKTLAAMAQNIAPRKAILAPADEDVSLLQAVARLRSQGERVIQSFPADQQGSSECCDRVLEKQNDSWVVTTR